MEDKIIINKEITQVDQVGTQVNQHEHIYVWIDFEIESQEGWRRKLSTLYMFHIEEETLERKYISTRDGNGTSLTFTEEQNKEMVEFILSERNLLFRFKKGQEVYVTDEKRSSIQKGSIQLRTKKKIPYLQLENGKSHYFTPKELVFESLEEAQNIVKKEKEPYFVEFLKDNTWVNELFRSWKNTLYADDIMYTAEYYRDKYRHLTKEEINLRIQTMKEIIEEKTGIKL